MKVLAHVLVALPPAVGGFVAVWTIGALLGQPWAYSGTAIGWGAAGALAGALLFTFRG